MARPRTIQDDHLLRAAARVIAEKGPVSFALADVAKAAGVSAPLLLQRFGSKRGLLVALAATGARSVDAAFAGAQGPPLERLHVALATLAGEPTPRSVANGLAFLQLDVTDKELRPHAIAFFDAFRKNVRAALEDAIESRDLKRCDTEALAHHVEVVYNGATLVWALRQKGALAETLRHDLDVALDPYRREPLVKIRIG